MRENRMRENRSLAAGVLICGLALGLGGCAGVEPEKRAYPLAVSVDIQDGEYEVIYAMANLSADTGQGKDDQSKGGGQKSALLFRGENLQEIRKLYDATSQYKLDLGHVQAVILGERLLAFEEAAEPVFRHMETEVVLGKSACLFRTPSPAELMELNGSSGDSLGDYLMGFYENRSGTEKAEPLTLEDFFYVWNNYGEVPDIPEVRVEEGHIFHVGLIE